MLGMILDDGPVVPAAIFRFFSAGAIIATGKLKKRLMHSK
jgi:hypothetical protein